jgi:hypothetical protein
MSKKKTAEKKANENSLVGMLNKAGRLLYPIYPFREGKLFAWHFNRHIPKSGCHVDSPTSRKKDLEIEKAMGCKMTYANLRSFFLKNDLCKVNELDSLTWDDLVSLFDRWQAKKEPPRPEPVPKKAGMILEKLRSLPEHEGMMTNDLLNWLSHEHNIEMDDKTLGVYLKELKAYGVKNRRKVGYYVS